MRFQRVRLAAVTHELPPHVVSSAEIESRLASVYERLGLPEGRLELMSGIRERRFFDPGTRPGTVSARVAGQAVERSGLPTESFGALVHGSVCRDQMEPATACGVHHVAGLPDDCLVLDVSNACLGLLNGMLLVAQMIELGQVRAGVVVGTEIGRDLVEGTIDGLLADHEVTRKSIKGDFASLTIGSGSAAIVLCHEELAPEGDRFLGGTVLADTKENRLCAGGTDAASGSDGQRPRMQTDSEALLHAGVSLAERTWTTFLGQLDWQPGDVDKVVTHQVGRAHRSLLLERLGLTTELDFPTVEFLGNTGAVALPTAWSLAREAGHVAAGERLALLGIGSGLNCIMLGLERP